MHRSSQATASEIISLLDSKVWDFIATKTIVRMAPYILTEETTHLINDFSALVSFKKKDPTQIEEVPDHPSTLKENYIIGASKVVEQTLDFGSQPASSIHPLSQQHHSHVKSRARVKTEFGISHKKQLSEPAKSREIKSKSTFFKLTLPSQRSEQEEKIDEVYRTSKYSDIQYANSLEEARKELEVQRKDRKNNETKRFKEMKEYTYDFDGRLVLAGQRKTEKHQQIINIVSEFTEQAIHKTLPPSRRTSTKMKKIMNKKLVHLDKRPFLDPHQEKLQKIKEEELRQETERRRISFLKNDPTNKFNNLFNKNTRVQVGVSIINLENRELVQHKVEKEGSKDTRMFKLSEFKEHNRLNEHLTYRNNIKVRKTGTSHQRTEGDEKFELDSDRPRIKTQGNEREFISKQQGEELSSKMTQSFKRTTGKGKIRICHPTLYSQNFSPDRYK